MTILWLTKVAEFMFWNKDLIIKLILYVQKLEFWCWGKTKRVPRGDFNASKSRNKYATFWVFKHCEIISSHELKLSPKNKCKDGFDETLLVRWVSVISCVGYNTSCFLVNFLKGCITSGLFPAIISLCLGQLCTPPSSSKNAFGNKQKMTQTWKVMGRKNRREMNNCSTSLWWFFLPCYERSVWPIELTHGLGKSLHL